MIDESYWNAWGNCQDEFEYVGALIINLICINNIYLLFMFKH